MKRRGNREGSIYRDGRGRWRGAVVLSDGRRKYVSGRTRKEVADKVATLTSKRLSGGAIVMGRGSVGEWLEEWLAHDACESVRPSTLYDYRGIVRNSLIPHLGRIQLVELSPRHVAGLHRNLLDGGMSPARILKVHRVLSRALNVAVRWERVERNVASLVTPPRVEAKPQKYLTMEQLSQLMGRIDVSHGRARWLLALLGLRQGEVLGLAWESVDLATGELRVAQALQRQRGKGLVLVPPKSSAGRRTLIVPEQVRDALKVRKAAQSADRLRAGCQWRNEWDLVFTDAIGRPIDPSSDHRAWKALLVDADLETIKLHDARHTAATLLLKSGVGVRAAMEWLGHSQVSQTMRYTHVLSEVAQDTSRRIGSAMFSDSDGKAAGTGSS